ncbi:M20/M25/M40 family metallo-hydrolase [Agromyces intestinalis]|uniref:M20/M25/M40 family metallo-hydrolase n=1 Tax=Agromyces intestinalis TaxID=2592652 RepID=A0A5C1YCA7_9MICO|nr:M20/M25/M40 family metallo-hydrolase [Agromyces intestinalis]QEO12985.1 M20/M25/M40 family metallo-hydrolase [Agromyces intestinalis]
MAESSANPDAPTELEETARIARDLIRIDTTNHGEGRSNGEREAAEYVEAELAALGLEPRIFESAPGRASVVARVPGRNPAKPGLVLHGHLDVVPADSRAWSVDPFAGEIRDDCLWGRGAVDMKDMDAMILTSIGDILRSGDLPERETVVAFFADEEAGGGYGASWMVDEHPELFAGASEAISEVGGYSITVGGTRAYLLQTGEKALVWVRLRARGTAAHGSRLIRDNAVTRLAEAIAALGRTEWPVRLTDTTRELLGEIATALGVDPEQVSPDELALATGSASGFITATLRTTANPTLLHAGYKHNVIPDLAEALVDIRTLPGEEDQVLARVREIVGDDIEIEIVHRDVGLEAPTSGPLVDAVTRAITAHDPGAAIFPYMLSGGTDNKSLSRLGIRGYGFAPLRLPDTLDFPAMFHGVDERVPLDALAFGRQVLRDLLLDY